MAYDAARGRVVLFGGLVGATRVADTWEYDGTTWTKVEAGGPARSEHAMAYDASLGHVVMYGGFDDDGLRSDVWELSEGTWSLRTTTGGPPGARVGATLVYDAKRERLVMFGGADGIDDGADDGYLNDTWALADGVWTPLSTSSNPAVRVGHAATYDLARDRVVVFGGAKSDPDTFVTQYYDDSWEYDGTDWTASAAPATPSPRYAQAAAFDVSHGRLVMFGGLSSFPLDEVWTYDGTWRPLATNTGPLGRFNHAMAYDPIRRKLVVFGGNAIGTGVTDETWELDGTTWTLLPLTTSPPARVGAAMVFDVARGRIVLFGGTDEVGGYFADTWELDAAGMTWVPVTSASSPSARTNAGITYDASRRGVVLFGGETAFDSFVGETWLLANGGWTQIATSGPSPSPRRAPQLAYDASRNRVVLFGGDSLDGTSLDDLWQLGETKWEPYDVGPFAQSPPGTGGTVFAFDPVRQVSVLAGLTSPIAGTPTGFDTWELASVPLIAGEVCMAGRDLDGDGTAGCSDDECWGVCAPLCPPAADQAMCPSAPRCGDGMCDAVETCRACPADCPAGTTACPIVCGDGACDAAEDLTSCPGDCTP
jgi:hypothetical protein